MQPILIVDPYRLAERRDPMSRSILSSYSLLL